MISCPDIHEQRKCKHINIEYTIADVFKFIFKLFGIGFLIIFLLMVYALFAFSKNIEVNRSKTTQTIVIVNSYNINHPCSGPQDEGFRYEIGRKLKNEKNINIFVFDMNTKTQNTSEYQKRHVAREIIKKINRIKPDIIYTTDDNALLYVGIPLSTKYQIIASGINKPYRQYINEFKLKRTINKIYFVQEYTKLDCLWNILDKSRLYVNKFYIIADDPKNSTITNYYLLQNYINEIRGHADYEVIHVKYLSQLKKLILDLNKEPQGIIVPVIQRVIDDYGDYKNKAVIIKVIRELNKKHLELGGNFVFCKIGLGICIMPDFWNMGKLSADIAISVIEYDKNHKKDDNKTDSNLKYMELINIISANRVVINKKRIDSLGYRSLLNSTDSVYKIYDKYYDIR